MKDFSFSLLCWGAQRNRADIYFTRLIQTLTRRAPVTAQMMVCCHLWLSRLSAPGAPAQSLPAELAAGLGDVPLLQLGVLRVEAEQGQQSEPFDSQHKRCPVRAAFGQPASCCADTLPWHDGTGRHKSAMGQRGSGCENQRTAPVEVPVILYMKLLDKTTAFIQLC